MLIARVYSTLAAEADREAIFPQLEAEHRKTEKPTRDRVPVAPRWLEA